MFACVDALWSNKSFFPLPLSLEFFFFLKCATKSTLMEIHRLDFFVQTIELQFIESWWTIPAKKLNVHYFSLSITKLPIFWRKNDYKVFCWLSCTGHTTLVAVCNIFFLGGGALSENALQGTIDFALWNKAG